MFIKWDKIDERYFEHGLDRGVLYIDGLDPVPWNGLTGFDEGGDASASVLYRDGVVYLADVEASDFSGKLNAMFFPDEFRPCIGMAEAIAGMYVDNQKPKRFGFSYRSLIGSGAAGDMFGYQIHLVYNAVASIGPRSRSTLGSETDPVDFSFDIVCTPERLPGYRPTAHYIIDTRSLNPQMIEAVENLLYGDDQVPATDIITEPIEDPIPGFTIGRMPTPLELYTLLGSDVGEITEFVEEFV